MIFLIILIFLIIILFTVYYILKRKVESFLLNYFNTKDLKEVIEKTELESENTPKSVYGMENVYKDIVLKDFPDVNINELKSMVENVVVDSFNAIESGDISNFNYDSSKIKSFVESKINDFKDKDVKFEDIHFHKTVLSRYENSDGIATMYFQTSLEYYQKIGNKPKKKIQDRYKVNFIYIIDRKEFVNNSKALGLNCPNCGAPITDVGVKVCKYCGTGVKDLVKKTWIFNNIEKF